MGHNDSSRGQFDRAEAVAAGVRAVLLPEILKAEDVQRALGLGTLSGARRAIVSGRCGSYVRSGRRLLVLRADFLEHLRSEAVDPAARRPRALPAPKPETLKALGLKPRPRRGRGGR